MTNVVKFTPSGKPSEGLYEKNVVQFPIKAEIPGLTVTEFKNPKSGKSQANVAEPPKYELGIGLSNRLEMWSPSFFGVSFLIWGSGKNEEPPEFTPPSGGTPVANRASRPAREKIYAVAA